MKIRNLIHSLTAPKRNAADFGSYTSVVRSMVSAGDVKLESPYLQHGYAHGAIRLAGQMLGAVPFSIVQKDSQAVRQLREAKSLEDLRLEQHRHRLLLEASPQAASHRAAGVPVVKVDGHPFARLFEKPNASMGGAQFFGAIIMQQLAHGDCVVYWRGGLDGTLDERTMPTEAWVLPRAAFNRDGRGRWVFNSKQGKVIVPDWQVCDLPLYSPDGTAGVSPLQPVLSKMRQDLLADAWNSAFFENGAEHGVTLLSEQTDMTEAEAKALLSGFEARHQGVHRRKRPALLTGGIKVERDPATHRDMEFLEMQESNRDAVLAALGFHKALLGVTDSLNRATITEARRMAWSNLLKPMAAQIEDRFNAHLFSRFDAGRTFGVFDLSAVEELAADTQSKAQTVQTLTSSGIPLNDAIDLVGLPLPRYDWGDTATIPTSLQTWGDLDSEPEPRAIEARELPQLPDSLIWERAWTPVGGKAEKKMHGTLRRVIFAMRKDQLDKLAKPWRSVDGETRKPSLADVEAMLFDEKRWQQGLRDGLEPRYKELSREAVKALNRELKRLGLPEVSVSGDASPFNLGDKAVTTLIDARGLLLDSVVENIRDSIKSEIIKGIEAGENVNKIQDRIRSAFNQMSSGRALTIARTETASAMNTIRDMGMKAAGVEMKRWIAAPDARETHAANHDSEPRHIDAPWDNGLQFPSDPSGEAGEVINCRCVQVGEVPSPNQ